MNEHKLLTRVYGIPIFFAVPFLSIAFAACTTARSEKGIREPAQEEPKSEDPAPRPILDCRKFELPDDRRACARLERASIEALGLMIQHKLIATKLARLELSNAENVRGPAPSSFSGVRGGFRKASIPNFASSIGLHAGVAGVLTTSAFTLEGSSIQELASKKPFTPVAGISVSGNVVSFTVTTGLIADNLIGAKSSSADPDALDWVHSGAMVTASEHDAAALPPRDEFDTAVRFTSADIATRISLLFGLLPTERMLLTKRIESTLMKRFGSGPVAAQAVGKVQSGKSKSRPRAAPSVIELDIMAMLKAESIDVSEQTRVLAEYVAAERIDGDCLKVESRNEMRGIFVHMNEDLTYLVAKELEVYNELDLRHDPRFAGMMRDLIRHAHECEKFQLKVQANLEDLKIE